MERGCKRYVGPTGTDAGMHCSTCALTPAPVPTCFHVEPVTKQAVPCGEATNNNASLQGADAKDQPNQLALKAKDVLCAPIEYSTPRTRLPASVASKAGEPLITPRVRDSMAHPTTMPTPARSNRTIQEAAQPCSVMDHSRLP